MPGPRTKRKVSGRDVRRRAARAADCSLCFKHMTHQDQQPYRLGPAHPKCITQAALAEAAQAKATLEQIQSNAATTMGQIATQQRAQAMGLWLPGQQ